MYLLLLFILMVVIAGFRDHEYYVQLLLPYKMQIVQQLLLYVQQMDIDSFFELVCKCLSYFTERMDGELGIHGNAELKQNYSKIPFCVLSDPGKYLSVHLFISQSVFANMHTPYDAERILKWTDQKTHEVIKSVLDTLYQQLFIYAFIIHPDMPEFMSNLVMDRLNHLRFCKIVKPQTVRFSIPASISVGQIHQSFLITAPYDDSKINAVMQNYKGQKRGHQDNLNIVKQHFCISHVYDKMNVETHIFRTPTSYNGDLTKYKLDEIKRSSVQEEFKLLGTDLLVDNQHLVESVGVISLLFVFDAEYFNEYPKIEDYGFSDYTIPEQKYKFEPKIYRRLNILKTGIDIENTRNVRFSCKNSDKYRQKAHELSELEYWIKKFQFAFGSKLIDVNLSKDLQQKLVGSFEKEYQYFNTQSAEENAKLVQHQINYQLKGCSLDFVALHSNFVEFVHSQYYDQDFQLFINQQILVHGLQEKYTKKTVTATSGKQVDLEQLLCSIGTKEYKGIENKPQKQLVTESQLFTILDIQPCEVVLQQKYEDYIYYKQVVQYIIEEQSGMFTTPLELADFLPMDYQDIVILMKILGSNQNVISPGGGTLVINNVQQISQSVPIVTNDQDLLLKQQNGIFSDALNWSSHVNFDAQEVEKYLQDNPQEKQILAGSNAVIEKIYNQYAQ